MAGIDDAGRAIAGLLTYNPGPGIYSRLERAIEAMPDNVRAQELPGLLKRYKDGVPGWELKAVDLDSVIAGRDVVPKAELLSAVQGRSPVYTHKEIVLGESGPHKAWPGLNAESQEPGAVPYADLPTPSRIGSTGSTRHGQPVYKEYGQGGEDYTEVLLAQPIPVGPDYGNHWSNAGAKGVEDAVAHARFDTHGDALRINELQSDLGIYNRKMREQDAEYQRVARELGPRAQQMGFSPGQTLPFPMEDAWSDLLIKRLALEAARKGHRAIEVASPRAIADKVGGNIDNYEHFYGKVVPGAIERLGRKMGGVTEDAATVPGGDSAASLGGQVPGYGDIADRIGDFQGPGIEALRFINSLEPPGPRPAFANAPQAQFHQLVRAVGMGPDAVGAAGTLMQAAIASNMRRAGLSAEEAAVEAAQHLPKLVRLAEQQAEAYASHARLRALGDQQETARAASSRSSPPPGRRYILSDEMRRRLIEQGVGASVLAPLLATEEE
jgi:hypothetical protein